MKRNSLFLSLALGWTLAGCATTSNTSTSESNRNSHGINMTSPMLLWCRLQ